MAKDIWVISDTHFQQMIDEGKPDLVVAFPGGRGTQDMIKRAKGHHIKVVEVKSG